MATKLLIDFDCNLVAGQSTAPTSWENCAKPVGVYTVYGVTLSNPNIDNQLSNPITNIGVSAGRDAGSSAYGSLSDFSYQVTYYSLATQVAVNRGKYAIGDEVYCTFDIRYRIPSGQTYPGARADISNTRDKDLFRWGNLNVVLTAINYTAPTYQAVFTVYNNSTTVGTITVPDVTSSTWHYCKVKAKLHNTTGYIEVNIDGYTHAAYVNQNTVPTILLASTGTTLTADHIYFSPPVYRMATTQVDSVGLIDNISVGESAFPAGRINARRWTIGAASVDSGWAAVGTSPTTVSDALNLPTDAKAARGTGVGASTLIDIGSGFDFTGMAADIIGINVYLKQPASRDSFVARHIAVGVSISGVHTMDTVVAAEPLHIDNPVIPPNVNYTFGGLGGGVFSAGLTQTNFPNTTIRLLVS